MVRSGSSDSGNISPEINPSSQRGVKKDLILDLAQSGLPKILRESEKVALVLGLTAVNFDGPAADPVKDATARFNSEADTVAKANKLNDAQTRSLKLLGAAFLSNEKNAGSLMQKALNDLPADERLDVLKAFKKVLETNTDDKKLRVDIDGDGKGSYVVSFSGELVCDGKGKVKFNSQDASIKAYKEDGGDLPAEKAMSSRDSIRDQVASRYKPEEEKPAEKKEPDKPADANVTACRDAFEKRLKEVFKDNKEAIAAALAIFDNYKDEPAYKARFKEIQDKYNGRSDKDFAEKERANSLTELFNAWVEALKKVKPISPDILKSLPDLKKTKPDEAAKIEASVKLQAARDKWLEQSKGKPIPAIELPKEAPAEPKAEAGVVIAGLTPDKQGATEDGAVRRYQALVAKGKLEGNEPVELKMYKEFGWTSNELHYQYARAAYLKGADLGLEKAEMANLEKLLKYYVSYYDNGKKGTAPDIAGIKKLLKLP